MSGEGGNGERGVREEKGEGKIQFINLSISHSLFLTFSLFLSSSLPRSQRQKGGWAAACVVGVCRCEGRGGGSALSHTHRTFG